MKQATLITLNFRLFGVLCALLFYQGIRAQETINTAPRSKLYEFIIECPLYRCDINGIIVDSSIQIAPPHAKFLLIDEQKEYYIIRFTLLPNKKNAQTCFINNDFSTYQYFRINKAQLDFKATNILNSKIDFLVGNIFSPIKLRFKPFDFSKDISIGSTFGFRYSFKSDHSLSIASLLGFGISAITVDSTSFNSQATNDILSFSGSTGMVLAFGNAQLGIFAGYDFISAANQNELQWHYHNKPWLSIGIGYSLFSFNVKK